jgi:hypothetical protein
MLPPECSHLLVEEYMGDTEDPETLQAQFREMLGDFMFVIPALQVAHFQREYIWDKSKDRECSELWDPCKLWSAQARPMSWSGL